MNRILYFLLCLFLCARSVSAEAPEFKQVDGSLALQFPRDHGAHPDYSTEWWYFVGHLKDARQRTCGFELTFFRIGVGPKAESLSAWRARSLHLTHFALTDDQTGEFFHDQRTNREAFEQAGASESGLEVWNRDWKASLDKDVLTLRAESEDFSVRLDLSPAKPLVLQGKDGFSRKGPKPGQASYYTSFTRLEGGGSISVKGKEFAIEEARAWMDHEVTSEGLPENIAGWDWFAIQLDNNEEFMLYRLRTKENKKDIFSKGSYIRADGSVTPLKHDDYTIEAINEWVSPETGIRYPSGWRVEVLKTGHQFEIIPTVVSQELLTGPSTGVNYWEGRCLVKAAARGNPLDGAAYVELTGYDKALKYN